MKKYIIACAVSCTLALTSCVDLLQEPLSAPTPENIIYTEDMVTAKANGLYTDLWKDNYGFNCRIAALSVGADDVITGNLSKVRTTRIDELRTESSGDDVKQLWANLYLVIYSANSMINDITPNDGLTMEIKKKYLGEAHFMRALSYFYLVRYFGDIPAITDPESKMDVLGSNTIIRNKTIDVYEKIIIPDLKIAEEYLPATSRITDNSKATKWAAKTCLADVYLTMAGWPLKQTANYALAASKAAEIMQDGPHDLTPIFKDLWLEAKKSDATEHIFALHHSAANKTASQYGTSYLAAEENNGWSDYLADAEFFKRFPNDERKKFVYQTTFVKGTETKSFEAATMKSPFIRKYRNYGGCGKFAIEKLVADKNQAGQSDGLTPIYRYADVLFIYAEASNMAEGKPNTLAYSCINDIRKRANGGTANDLTPGLTKDAFDKAVFDERGWEFFCEFKRWFQLVRTEKVDEMNKLNPRIKESGRLDCNKENYLMPLPDLQVELSGWSNNPGY